MKVSAWIFACAAVLAGTMPAGAQGFKGGHREAFGPLFSPANHEELQKVFKPGSSPVHRWNEIAVDASGLDHTPVALGENRVFGEQLGPCRSSRAMAIVHIAIFDALNSIEGGYDSYTGIKSSSPNASIYAAVAQAAHDTLIVLYPSQKTNFDAQLSNDLKLIHNNKSRNDGVNAGQRAAAAILKLRKNDGSQTPEPKVNIDFLCSNLAGKWRQDPITLGPLALGAHWPAVKPFVVHSSNQFRAPPPPAMTSTQYTDAYNQVLHLGGDVTHTPTDRTDDETEIGTFWAYDGTPSLCAPPRLYNQVAVEIADELHTSEFDLARLLATMNTALADAAIECWDSKFFYQFWRPITGIRESDPGTGPTSSGDGNANTVGDPGFTPLGAPASNLTGPNFTPPFPSYPSGHATFGGALFQTLRRFYHRDNIHFTFISDEFNGVTQDRNGNVRPLSPRSYVSLTQAELENGVSRVYLGIHWPFDISSGIVQGRKVGDYVFDHAFGRDRHGH